MPRIGAKTIAMIWNFLCERRGRGAGTGAKKRPDGGKRQKKRVNGNKLPRIV